MSDRVMPIEACLSNLSGTHSLPVSADLCRLICSQLNKLNQRQDKRQNNDKAYLYRGNMSLWSAWYVCDLEHLFYSKIDLQLHIKASMENIIQPSAEILAGTAGLALSLHK